jgi:hypothetical protein
VLAPLARDAWTQIRILQALTDPGEFLPFAD